MTDNKDWGRSAEGCKREIIKRINALSGSRSPYEVFCDWVKCYALAIRNSCDIFRGEAWRKREKEYLQTIRPYEEKGNTFAEMCAILAMALGTEITDILGQIYMEAGLGNKQTGQFFTPFHISRMCAQMSLAGWDGQKVLTLNEPSCGGGGMIIAAAAVLKEQGVNYQRCLDVVAQDLDYKAVYMCYIQLSLLGIKAVVVQGNTLSDPYIPGKTSREHLFITPAKLGMLI